MAGNLAVHHLATGQRVAITRMPITGPEQVLVTPDGSRIAVLVTASVHIFDANHLDARPKRVVNPGRKKIETWAMHPSGRQLVTTWRHGGVRVIDMPTAREVTTYSWGVGRLSALAFSPDGTLCAAAGSHGAGGGLGLGRLTYNSTTSRPGHPRCA